MVSLAKRHGGTGRSDAVRAIWHLALLLLLVCGWAILIFRVPMLLQQVYPDFYMDRESGTATLALSNQNVHRPWSQEMYFDVHSGEFDWKTSYEVDDVFLGRAIDPKNRGYRILNLNGQLTEGKYRLVAPPESGIPDRFFQFPQYPYLVNQRFAVTADADDLVVMDFSDASLTLKRTKVGGFPITGGLRKLEGVNGILRFQNLPAIGNPPTYQVQHFTIDENQNAVPGLIWQVVDVSPFPFQSVAVSGDRIVSINPTNFEVEFREVSNGKLIQTMPLLEGMDPVTMPCDFWENYLRVEPTTGSPRFLDLQRGSWLPPVEGENFGPHSELDGRFILFIGTESSGWGLKSKVFDVEQQAVIAEFVSWVRTDFIDEDSILDVSFLSGLTFQKIDVQTGKVLQSWTPFWWVIPTSSFLCIAWLVWSWSWLVGAGRGGHVAVWLDVVLIALLPLVFCIVRVKWIGDITDLSRIPTQISQSIILALMLSGVVWMVHAKVRLVPRILPFLLATAILVGSVSITFEGQLSFVITGAIKAMIPVSVYFVCFLILRKLGYRLVPPGHTDSVEPTEKFSSVTIRDMFVLMAALALLFAGLSPWLTSAPDVFQSLAQAMGALVFFATLSLAPVVAWWLAMSRKRTYLVGILLFLAAFGFLLVSAAYRFAGTTSLIYALFGVFPTFDALPTFCFVATYCVATCFRFRGWQFSNAKVRDQISEA